MEDILCQCQGMFEKLELSFKEWSLCQNARTISNHRQSAFNNISSGINNHSLSQSNQSGSEQRLVKSERIKASKSFKETSPPHPYKQQKRVLSYSDKFAKLTELSKANQTDQLNRVQKARHDWRVIPEQRLEHIISGSGRYPRAPHMD